MKKLLLSLASLTLITSSSLTAATATDSASQVNTGLYNNKPNVNKQGIQLTGLGTNNTLTMTSAGTTNTNVQVSNHAQLVQDNITISAQTNGVVKSVNYNNTNGVITIISGSQIGSTIVTLNGANENSTSFIVTTTLGAINLNIPTTKIYNIYEGHSTGSNINISNFSYLANLNVKPKDNLGIVSVKVNQKGNVDITGNKIGTETIEFTASNAQELDLNVQVKKSRNN